MLELSPGCPLAFGSMGLTGVPSGWATAAAIRGVHSVPPLAISA
jgi:hypothetical protein